jgi:uncharacterized protein YbgA (DUF1722 family)
MEAGLGSPRESMRLVRGDGGILLRTVKTDVDLTDRMTRFSCARVAALAAENLSGFVVKKDSPSCGFERVKVYDRHGSPIRSGRGVFTAALLTEFPNLPVEEEGRLSNPELRENFVERVFAYARLRRLFARGWRLGALVRFHTAHKLTLMAHSPEAYRELGRLTANARAARRDTFAAAYTSAFMAALSVVATRRRHTNVLQHIAGSFTNALDAASKRELLDTIEDYRRGLAPLIAATTLVRHHVRVCGIDYLAGQAYLDPHPRELMLRNHA